MPSYEELRNEFIGCRFRHFKGNIYLVTDIAVHTETGEPMVIYKDENDSVHHFKVIFIVKYPIQNVGHWTVFPSRYNTDKTG